MIKDLKYLHYERNWFTAIFSMMSKEVIDVDSGKPAVFFKMSFGADFHVYSDKTKSRELIKCVKPSRMGYTWDVFDVEKQEQKIGSLTWNVLKSAMHFGAETWTINGPDGGVFLTLDTEGDNATKRIFDNMSGLYNPTHKYVVKGVDGVPVATFSSKHGLFKGVYDFVFVGGTEEQKKVALALFAGILLMLKK